MLNTAEVNAMNRGRTLADWVVRKQFGTYLVPSQSEEGVTWTVIDTPLGLRCACPAGIAGRPCAHKAAVVVRRQSEATRSPRRIEL